jgi:hypothetical protein
MLILFSTLAINRLPRYTRDPPPSDVYWRHLMLEPNRIDHAPDGDSLVDIGGVGGGWVEADACGPPFRLQEALQESAKGRPEVRIGGGVEKSFVFRAFGIREFIHSSIHSVIIHSRQMILLRPSMDSPFRGASGTLICIENGARLSLGQHGQSIRSLSPLAKSTPFTFSKTSTFLIFEYSCCRTGTRSSVDAEHKSPTRRGSWDGLGSHDQTTSIRVERIHRRWGGGGLSWGRSTRVANLWLMWLNSRFLSKFSKYEVPHVLVFTSLHFSPFSFSGGAPYFLLG